MPAEITTVERTVTIGSRVGLHARPAAAVVQLAGSLPAVVTISKDGRSGNARSVLSLIALGAQFGDEVTLRAEGDGAEESVAALADLIATDQDSAT